MPSFRSKLSIILVASTLLAGCTWVKIAEEARALPILEESAVSGCKHVGGVSTQVKWQVVGVSRDPDKVQSELDDLARQQALELGADTLVRESVGEGKGRYQAFDCAGAMPVS